MKVLSIVSALDLRMRFGATSAWWQLFKGLSETGVEVIATPYAGRAIESLWWRSYPNPCFAESAAFIALKSLRNRAPLPGRVERSGRMVRAMARWLIFPRWKRHVTSILERERDIDAVLIFNVPMNHLTGLPTLIRQRFSLPVLYVDGDMPMSLPSFGGYASGVQGYTDADLSEYDAFITNSIAGGEELKKMGARRAHTLHFAADPELFHPQEVEQQDIDVFFYGYGSEHREGYLRQMITEPSCQMPGVRFVVGGARLNVDMGVARRNGPILTSQLRGYTARSRLNLNISRRPHATYYGSSCMRLFELAALGCCIVSNPINGVKEWFEPGLEIVLAEDGKSVAELYRDLLSSPNDRRALGQAARRRLLECHTYKHRARELTFMLLSIGGGG